MAKAYQCDRCKSFFEERKRKLRSSKYYIEARHLKNQKDLYLDLCSDCLDSLDDWFSKGQPEKEQDHDNP